MPLSEGYSNFSIACCSAAINITQARTHSNASQWSRGSHFPPQCVQSECTTVSMLLCSTVTHLLLPVSHQLNRSRRSCTTVTNMMWIKWSTVSDTTGSFFISYSGQVTVRQWLGGNLERISGMRWNWTTSFTVSIQGSLHDDWTSRSGIGQCKQGFYFAYCDKDLGPV